jgi:hypothetical protein
MTRVLLVIGLTVAVTVLVQHATRRQCLFEEDVGVITYTPKPELFHPSYRIWSHQDNGTSCSIEPIDMPPTPRYLRMPCAIRS